MSLRKTLVEKFYVEWREDQPRPRYELTPEDFDQLEGELAAVERFCLRAPETPTDNFLLPIAGAPVRVWPLVTVKP